MKWTPGGSTEDIEDRRGQGGGGFRGGPVGHRRRAGAACPQPADRAQLPVARGPQRGRGTDQPSSSGPVTSSPDEDRLVQFVTFVLDDAQETWARLLPAQYRDAKLVLFRDATPTGVRHGPDGERAVLLPGRREGLHRPRLLRRAAAALRRRRATSRRRTSSPTSSGITSSTCSASSARPRRRRSARPTAANAALGAARAAGRLLRRRLGRTRRRSARHPRARRRRGGANAAASIGDDRIQRSRAGACSRNRSPRLVRAARGMVQAGLQSGDLDACDTFARGTD